MEEMKSFRERRDDSSLLTWEVLRLEQLKEIARARSNSDTDKFAATVDALDILTNGEKDDEFYHEFDLLIKKHKDAFNGSIDATENEIYDYRRDHALLLVNLTSRIDRGEISIAEAVSDSRIMGQVALQVQRGIGQNIYITGKPGSGKSWACLRAYEILANMIGVKVEMKHLVSFNNVDFMDVIDDLKKIPRGGVAIFEEVGVNVNAKSSMTILNRTMSSIFQTVRERGIVCIMNAPDLGFLDKDVRKLLHFWFETEKLLPNLGECWVKPHVVEVDQRTGNILYPYPRFGEKSKIQRIKFTAPDKVLTDQYEQMASKYKADLRAKARIELRQLDPDRDPTWEEFKKHLDEGTSRTDAMKKMQISPYLATKLYKKYKDYKEVYKDVAT